MVEYNIAKGGRYRTHSNNLHSEFPSVPPAPFEYDAPTAHARPSQFMVNRSLWFGEVQAPETVVPGLAQLVPVNDPYYTHMEGEETSSPSLRMWLANLRKEGVEVTTADKLWAMNMPIDHTFDRLFVRNMRAAPGYVVRVRFEDRVKNEVIHDFGTFDLTHGHLELDRIPTSPNTVTEVYTEHFIPPMWVPTNQMVAAQRELAAAMATSPVDQAAVDAAQAKVDAANLSNGVGYFMGHNHKLTVQVVSMPNGGRIDAIKMTLAAQITSPFLGVF